MRVRKPDREAPGEYAFLATQFGTEMWTTGMLEFGID